MLFHNKTLAHTFDLSKKITDYLQSLESKKIVIGFSGWPDSVATYHIISDYFLSQWRDVGDIFLAHYNHNMRSESAQEAEDIITHYPKVIIWSYKWSSHKEQDMRKARHKFFQQVLREVWSKTLILWHNLTDRLETTIMNMERWCDYNGIANMLELQHKLYLLDEHYIILRPLLYNPKHYIIQYCIDQNLSFLHDKTNDDISVSKRNMIRYTYIKPLESGNIDPINAWRQDIRHKFAYDEFLELDLYELFEILIKESDLWTGIASWYRIFFEGVYWDKATKIIYLPSYFGFDYIYYIEEELTTNRIVRLLNGIGEWWNINKPYLEDLLHFCSRSSWHKQIGKRKLELAHGQLFLYLTNKEFDAWQVLTYWISLMKGHQDFRLYEGFDFKLVDLQQDVYKSKPINKRFINNKVPRFIRHLVPLKTDNWGNVYYLDNLIINHLYEWQYVKL